MATAWPISGFAAYVSCVLGMAYQRPRWPATMGHAADTIR